MTDCTCVYRRGHFVCRRQSWINNLLTGAPKSMFPIATQVLQQYRSINCRDEMSCDLEYWSWFQP